MLSPPIIMSLDDCLEYIVADELVEVRIGKGFPNGVGGRWFVTEAPSRHCPDAAQHLQRRQHRQ